MVVVMLAAEDPSVDGHLASTPRRRVMGGVVKPSNTNKKLVQARLPFKRLNPEPKQSSEPKRTRAPLCPESGASDGENESDRSQHPMRHGPALVNGRGPLDGFMSRHSSHSPSAKSVVVDLTSDNSNSSDPPVLLPATPASTSASCPTPTQDNHPSKAPNVVKATCTERTPKTAPAKCRVVANVQEEEEEEEEEEDDDEKMEEEDDDEKMEEEDSASVSQLDTTQGSENEEEREPVKAEVSSHANESMLSPSSSSSLSAAESSPEQAKTERAPADTEPNTTPKIEQKNVKRRSLKSLQEQEERLRQRQEREQQREEAKAAKEKKKEEARKLKEEREKERKEKKEKEEREKLEKKEKEEKEKAEKLKAKEEQRKSKQEAKLEEKRKKEEEKRMKEDEKRLKEEKDRLKAEKAEITRFLQKPKTQQAPKTLASACGKFAPFEIKAHMCLAPLTRVQCDDSVLEALDRYLAKPDGSLDGLRDWTSNKPRRSGPTRSRQTLCERDCIVTVEGPKPDGVPDRSRYGPSKLLQFRENHRPAYWGTWSKKSAHISPRCPLRQDKELLDYEVDSDDEWEEEEPGESLSHSEGEGDDDEAGENDDDDDDGFFVPHGYLSDGEGAREEEEGGDLEKQKVRQKLKAREWDELMSKKKLKVLEAVVRGCVWEGEGPPLELFQPFAVCLLEPLPKAEATTPEESSKKQQRNEQLLSQLLPLLHGNINGKEVIVTEFQEFCRQQSPSPIMSSPPSGADSVPSRIHLKRLIKSNAVYVKRSSYRPCWYVHTEVLARFNQEALPVPCQWNYLTSGAQVPRDEPTGAATGSQGNSPTTPQSSSTTPSSSCNKRKSAGSMSITKFMKKCADPERTEAMETDGFQADTEDDEEDPDCVIISTQSGSSRENTSTPITEGESTEQMEVTPPSDAAAVPLPRPAPTPATA